MMNGARWKLDLAQRFKNTPALVTASWVVSFLLVLKIIIFFTAKHMPPFALVLGIINPFLSIGALSLALLYFALRRNQGWKILFWLGVLVFQLLTL